MDETLQNAAVRRCASELSRAIWYAAAVRSLQDADRDDTANFIRLAEIAMGDQMIAHAVKVLSIDVRNGRGEVAGLWSLCKCWKEKVEEICKGHYIDLDHIRRVGDKLYHIRNKTHFHLDRNGVISSKTVWKDANIKSHEFDKALSQSYVIIYELYNAITGIIYQTWEYDGSDAKIIAQHANKHNLLYREPDRTASQFLKQLYGDED